MFAYCAAATRILFFKRHGTPYRPYFALQAWLLMVVLIGSAVDVFFDYGEVRLFDALRAVITAAFIFYAGGNVSWLLSAPRSRPLS